MPSVLLAHLANEKPKVAKALQTMLAGQRLSHPASEMCLSGICQCPQQQGCLCTPFLQTIMLLTVKLFLGVMGPLGLLLMELWSCNFPLMLNTRGRRALPSGVGLHPAQPLGCYATGCGAKVASVCTCPKCMLANADQNRHHHLLCNGLHNPLG